MIPCFFQILITTNLWKNCFAIGENHQVNLVEQEGLRCAVHLLAYLLEGTCTEG